MKVKLREIAEYVNIKINSNNLSLNNYISTENMLPDRKGISMSSNIPNNNVNKFLKNDILISNIRPYFKKIWFAIFEGGASNDILVIRGNNKVNSKYLYYLLSTDDFFDYNVKGSKGTKMPRGDKEHIMNYEFKLPSLKEQKRIADILTALDDKIELNNQMNQTLEEIASLLYKRWFVDFEFPDDKGNPYKSSGGEMVESELGMIPKGWEVKELGEICVNSDSKRKPLSKNQRERLSGDYPYYGAASIIDYVNDYIFDGTYLLVGEDGTVVTKDGKPILQYITGKIWVNNHAHVLQGKDVSTGFLFCKLSQFDVTHLVTGAVQMKITQSNLNKIKFVISESNIQKRFEKIITLLFNKRNENKIYNEALKKIKKELVIKLI